MLVFITYDTRFNLFKKTHNIGQNTCHCFCCCIHTGLVTYIYLSKYDFLRINKNQKPKSQSSSRFPQSAKKTIAFRQLKWEESTTVNLYLSYIQMSFFQSIPVKCIDA